MCDGCQGYCTGSGAGAWISHAELENRVNLQLGMFVGWKELT